jgi:hypothetical protein
MSESKWEISKKKLIDYWIHWIRLGAYIKNVPKLTIKNPKFIFSMLVIMSISSSGVWIPWFFNIDLSMVCNLEINKKIASEVFFKQTDAHVFAQETFNNSCEYIKKLDTRLLQNFSIFMFNLGILGGIAAEYFIRSKVENTDFEDTIKQDEYHVKEYAGFFCWFISLILSFTGLREPMGDSFNVVIASVLSIFLWICTNLKRKEYTLNDAQSILGGSSEDKQKLEGDGLTEESTLPETNNTNIQGRGLEE